MKQYKRTKARELILCRKCGRLLVSADFDIVEGAYRCPGDGWFSCYDEMLHPKPKR